MRLARLKRRITLIMTGRFDHILYALWFRFNRLDFAPASLEELGHSSERSVFHHTSGGADLAQVLRRLNIPEGSRALDLGSGKGGAVCTLAGFPFEEILGIELSERLIGIAEANIRKLNLKNVHFVCLDAGRFRDLDRFTHIYMYNPFPRAVVLEVVQNLTASLARTPRALTMIYYLPECDDVIMESGLFRREREITFQFSQPFYVYVHDVAKASMAKTAATSKVTP
jgi:protein-L-isoaspartate O-methyltransferase